MGGGHRRLGRSTFTNSRGVGYEIVHVTVDDASRLAFVQILLNDRVPTVAQFLLAAAAFFADRGIRIRHLTTQPYRPQTNGKAERFIATLLTQWAYARLYQLKPGAPDKYGLPPVQPALLGLETWPRCFFIEA